MKYDRVSWFLILVFTLSLCDAAAQDLSVSRIMAEPSIAGMRVDGEKLSPDGTKVAFLWNADGKMPLDIYVVETHGKTAPVRLLGPNDLPVPTESPTPENKLNYGLILKDDFTRNRENQIGGLEWSPNSKKILFSRSGDIYSLTLGASKPVRYTKTVSPESSARFLDNDRILFQQAGNYFVLNSADSTLVQLTKEADPQKFISVSNAFPNKNGSLLAYVVSDSSAYKSLVLPNYLDEFVQASTFRRGWSSQKLMVTAADGSRDTPFEIKLPKPDGVGNLRRIAWAADGRSLIVDRVDKDTKRRQLFYVHNAGGKDEQIILVTEETDDKWQAPLSAIVEPNPTDASSLLFGSERDGFNHLYLAKLRKKAVEPSVSGEIRGENPTDTGYSTDADIAEITKGPWQVEWAKWSNDGTLVIFSSTQAGTAQRSFYTYSTVDRTVASTVWKEKPGMKTGPQLAESDNRNTLIYSYSNWNVPDDVYAVEVCRVCKGITESKQITDTVPAAFAALKWVEPEFISVPSREGSKIAAKIYLPSSFSKKQKYPMVVFVHGAGYLQNVINGWNNYYREFMFNELLAQKGYVVLDIDYRGSAGYGREWRTGVYDFLGGKDMEDHIDAIDFMVANYNVNAGKVGVYGGSYGGFMAEMLAMRAPDKIAAAAALRPVADWKNYYVSSPGYTAQRLGFPDKNPKAYERSSPITYADKLQRPLLILHGEVDDNVPVQDSMQLVEKLIRLGKTQYFEVMFYPSENHGFVRPESWTDEYERILAFFEKHLK